MTEITMPKMGDGMEEGTLLDWLKKDGDTVKSGEIIGNIQTDKATIEMEAPGSGTITGFLVAAGETVPVGKPMAAILGKGESLPANWGSGHVAAAAPAAEAPKEKELVGAGASAPVAASAAAAPPSGRVAASPLARRIAEELGVDIASVKGTGPGGRIVEKDVKAAQSAPVARPQVAAAAMVPTAEDRSVKLTNLRRITAQRTAESKQAVPHYYVSVEVDVERLMALRETFDEEGGGKLSVNDFIVRACALALLDMPVVNASFNGNEVIEHGAVHIGIAAAVEEGLTVPVLKNAHTLTLREINRRSQDLVARARENKLSLDELSGSTFSISNMGMLDVDYFAAIINQPNAAILAVSSTRKKVVVNEDDEVEIRRRMAITASFDHRVVDGAVGAKFVNVVRAYLENPTRLLS
ncbi:MAG: 2-oxo acid dehydrogenase subunit E2 [Armatimonadetes bacterium]|nr:2-oxo acid dehydrogenase subunit E2 [Armatimonadota bacterium]